MHILRLALASSIMTGFVAAAACGGAVDQQGPSVDAGPDRRTIPPPVVQPPPPPEEPDGDITVDGVDSVIIASEFGAEVQMAVAKSGRIVVAWIGIGGGNAEIRYALSDDGGKTWTPAKTVGETVGDPVVGALDDDSFLLGGLRADCPSIDTCQNGELFLSRLPAGAASTTAIPSIREPTNAFIDHPWMVTHGQSVSLIGAVFPLTDAGTYQYGMTVWRSGDRGGTFDRTEVVAPTTGNEVGIPRFCGGDGVRTWAHFYDGTTPTFGRIRWTDALDDGWSATNTTSAGGNGSGGLSTTGACASHGDTLYALIGEAVTGGGGPDATPTYGDLHIMATSDLGKTWIEQSVIQSAGMQYLLPEINVEPDGTLDVFYYIGAMPNAPGRAELVRARNDGKTLDKPIVLRPDLRFVSDRGSQRWLGDYNAVGYAGGQPVFAFGDNAQAQTRVRFARVTK